MTIEDMKKQKLKLRDDIATLILQFETASGMKVDAIQVKRGRSYTTDIVSDYSQFDGVAVDVSLNG